MTTPITPTALDQEAKTAVLTHLYLELGLSVPYALEAARADLEHLDGFAAVAEAA